MSRVGLLGYREKLQREVNSESMLEVFFLLAFHCVCYYNQAQLPDSENPAPLPDC